MAERDIEEKIKSIKSKEVDKVDVPVQEMVEKEGQAEDKLSGSFFCARKSGHYYSRDSAC